MSLAAYRLMSCGTSSTSTTSLADSLMRVIYKRALAARRGDVQLEVPVTVTHGAFEKRYFLDVLAAGGGLFEFKAVDAIAARHKAQLIHYLMLVGLKHGTIANLRPEKVAHEFVNVALSTEERYRFAVYEDG